jgi:hypothetical protein
MPAEIPILLLIRRYIRGGNLRLCCRVLSAAKPAQNRIRNFRAKPRAPFYA